MDVRIRRAVVLRHTQRGTALWGRVVRAVVAARGAEGAEEAMARLMRSALEAPRTVASWLRQVGVTQRGALEEIEAALDALIPSRKERSPAAVLRARRVVQKACRAPKRVRVSPIL